MAKKGPSKHSRAARRATSPGIDIDKSLKNARPPTSGADHRPSVLGIHQAAGVSKKSRKQGRKSVLSNKARRRYEKGMDHAAAVLERTAQKVQRSKSQAKAIDYRRKAWDEINNKIETDVGVAKNNKLNFSVLAGDADSDNESEEEKMADSGDEAVRKFYGELDEEMGEAGDIPAAAAAVPLPANGEDEIL